MPTRNGTFYSIWPVLDGKALNLQWGQIRSNQAELKAIVRNSVQELGSGDELNALRALLGQEYGDLDFRNKFRFFYDASTLEICCQKNTGTVDVPVWTDAWCVRHHDGQFRVVSTGGIYSAAGFYSDDDSLHTIREVAESGTVADTSVRDVSRIFFNADDGFGVAPISSGANRGQPEITFTQPFGKAEAFTKAGKEWQVNHDFGISPVIAQVMDADDRIVIPDKADVSDPNTAYFYFNEPFTGSVYIASGGLGAASLVPRDPFYMVIRHDEQSRAGQTFSPDVDLIFDVLDFYVNVDLDEDAGGAHKSARISLTDNVKSPFKHDVTFQKHVRMDDTLNVENVVTAEAFYLTPGSGGEISKSGNDLLIKAHTGQVVLGSNVRSTGTVEAEAFYTTSGSEVHSLTVKETDGSPSVPNVKIINVNIGGLTDNGNGEVTIDLSTAGLDARFNNVTAEGFYVQGGGELGPTGLEVADGSVATPSISFVGDDDTGLYRPAANELVITLGGAQAVSFKPDSVRVSGIVEAEAFYTKTGGEVALKTDVSPGVFDIVVYGATGDGSTDDAPAIQAAINAAAAAGGGTVYAPTPSVAYKISTEITLKKNIIIEGQHLPSNNITLTPEGTVFLRGADIIMFNMTGTNRITDRLGRSAFRGIHFKDGTNVGNSSLLFCKYTDNMVIENCTFSAPSGNTTNGHMIDVEECWDWVLRNVLFKHYGDTSPTRHAINIFNGEDDNSNFWDFEACRFYNGIGGSAIFFDASGAGSTRNTQFFITRCKFEASDNLAGIYIDGDVSHLFIYSNVFTSGGSKHINVSAASTGWKIVDNLFSLPGDSPTEYISVLGTSVGIHNNNFSSIGAGITRAILVDFDSGGTSINITGNDFFEAVQGTTPLVATTGTLSRLMHIGNNNGDRLDDLATGTVTLQPWGSSRLDTTSAPVTATLPDGGEIGSQKTITMVSGNNEASISVTSHETGSPTSFSFTSVNDKLILVWGGSQWVTVRDKDVIGDAARFNNVTAEGFYVQAGGELGPEGLIVDGGSVAIPGIRFKGDEDTGIATAAAGRLSFVLNGSETLRMDNVGGQRNLLILSAGNAASPSLQFNDSDTGFFRAATDTLSLSVGGSEMVRWSQRDSDPDFVNFKNRVGINLADIVTPPSAELCVTGAAIFTEDIQAEAFYFRSGGEAPQSYVENFSAAVEWQVAHGLNRQSFIAQAYKSIGTMVIPDTIDVSDPNTAYFYFAVEQAGKAVILGVG